MFHTLVIDLSDEERKAMQVVADSFKKNETANHIPILSGVELGHFEFKTNERKTWSRKMNALFDEVYKTDKKMARTIHAISERIRNISLVQETDLRDICRESDKCLTKVFIQDRDKDGEEEYEPHTQWLVLGQVSVRFDLNPVLLNAYLTAGVTDFEHDSAYALRLPLIGVKVTSIRYQTTILEGWVAPRDLDEFHVPWPDYNPMKHPDAFECDNCSREEKHIMVPEGNYVPPTDKELYRYVAGRRVMIRIGIVRGDDD